MIAILPCDSQKLCLSKRRHNHPRHVENNHTYIHPARLQRPILHTPTIPQQHLKPSHPPLVQTPTHLPPKPASKLPQTRQTCSSSCASNSASAQSPPTTFSKAQQRTHNPARPHFPAPAAYTTATAPPPPFPRTKVEHVGVAREVGFPGAWWSE